MKQKLPRVLIAAEKSGAGKTTLVCALLQALQNRGIVPAACKCGPDYIDPMFHREIIGAKSANLDLFFTSENTAKQLLAEAAEGCALAVLEGVMGFYDGVGGTQDTASAYHLATATQTPVVLVLDAKGASLTLCAVVKGLCAFRENSGIRGVILNRCTAMQYACLAPLLAEECGVEALGYLPPMPDCTLQSRHLGLVTAAEVENLKEMLQRLAAQFVQSVNLPRLLEITQSAPSLCFVPEPVASIVPMAATAAAANAPRIGVAMDKAFCFYYRENLSLLEKLGAVLVPFSPLADSALPPDLDALYFGGGYPELYVHQLAENAAMRLAVKTAADSGMPLYAECGGFLYLHSALQNETGDLLPMAGVLDATCFHTGKLQRFGYLTLTAKKDTLLCGAGEEIRAHEFHYFDSTQNGGAFAAQKPVSARGWSCVVAEKNIFAGFPHLYFYANIRFAQRFVLAAVRYKSAETETQLLQ